jgi:hypothetical protein
VDDAKGSFFEVLLAILGRRTKFFRPKAARCPPTQHGPRCFCHIEQGYQTLHLSPVAKTLLFVLSMIHGVVSSHPSPRWLGTWVRFCGRHALQRPPRCTVVAMVNCDRHGQQRLPRSTGMDGYSVSDLCCDIRPVSVGAEIRPWGGWSWRLRQVSGRHCFGPRPAGRTVLYNVRSSGTKATYKVAFHDEKTWTFHRP